MSEESSDAGDDLSQNGALTDEALRELRNTPLYAKLLRALEKEAAKSQCLISELEDSLAETFTNSQYQTQVDNFVVSFLDKRPSSRETNLCVKQARLNWQRRLTKSINNMCTELNVPLARRRPDKAEKRVMAKWCELSQEEPDITQIKPIYAAKDLLEVVAGIDNSNLQRHRSPPDKSGEKSERPTATSCFLVNLKLSAPPHSAWCDLLSEFVRGPGLASRQLERILAAGDAALLRRAARGGLSSTVRPAAWQLLLGLRVGAEEEVKYEQLKRGVCHYDLLADLLVYKDIKQTIANSVQYFVFEDLSYQVLLPFLHDASLQKELQKFDHICHISYTGGHLNQSEYQTTYPPCGLLPYYSFSMLLAPLFYLYAQPLSLLVVFRGLYVTYFSQLHCLSTHPHSVVSLAHLFETLLGSHEPALSRHFTLINFQPLRLVFRWLLTAFADQLNAEDCLVLWDLILAHDTTQILSVFAAAIFTWRRSNLLQTTSAADAQACLADLSSISVQPVMHFYCTGGLPSPATVSGTV